LTKRDLDSHTSSRSLTHPAGNLNNKPAARNDHTAQPETEPALNRFALKPLALGPRPAANAISRHRQISAMSVSLTRTRVARLFSTRALTSSGNGNSACRTLPLSRCISSARITGARASAIESPGTSVLNRCSAIATFCRALLVYAGTSTSMNASGGELSPPASLSGRRRAAV